MSDWTYAEIKKGFKEANDAARAQGHYQLVPAGKDENGNTLYKKQVRPTDASKYWEAQESAYWFSVGR
ncbi:MAG: hypothetical protein ACAH83_13955 [Alphaproteobacteria bacterium]